MKSGFTLIELMIVVAIIGILAAIAIPQFAQYRIRAFNAQAVSILKTVQTAEEAYFAIWAFVTKLGAAVCGFVALQVLEHVGYIPGVAQTPRVIAWMLWMYSIFPAALYLLSALTLFRFNFTSQDVENTQRKLGRI